MSNAVMSFMNNHLSELKEERLETWHLIHVHVSKTAIYQLHIDTNVNLYTYICMKKNKKIYASMLYMPPLSCLSSRLSLFAHR